LRYQSPNFELDPLEARLQLSATVEDAKAAPKPVTLVPDSTWKLPDLTPLTSRGKQYVYGWELDTDQEPGHTLLRLTTAMANQGKGAMEIFTKGPVHPDHSRDVYQRIYTTDGKHIDRFAGTLLWHAAHQHYHFQDFAVYRLRHITANGGVGKVVATGQKASFCLTDVDSFNLKLPGAPKVNGYDSCSYLKQGISVGWADVYTESLDDQWIDVTKVPTGRYWLEVTADPSNRIMESNDNNNTIRVKINYAPPPPPPPPPANDNFADATVMGGQSANAEGSNVSASLETGEPDIKSLSGGASVWYRWTATADGTVSVDSIGSNFDTLLGVFTGNSVDGLTKVAEDDDGGGKQTSKLTFNAQAGITYNIQLDGYHGATGTFKLHLAPVASG
jgi:hypothetical protein